MDPPREMTTRSKGTTACESGPPGNTLPPLQSLRRPSDHAANVFETRRPPHTVFPLGNPHMDRTVRLGVMPEAPTATKLSSMEKYRFKRALEDIEHAEGRGTELVSVYVPPDRPIFEVTNYLRGEYSQSSNIKSTSTRKHVMQAIESIINRLKQWRMPPPNGLVCFVGHKDIGADQTSMVAYVLEPPEPVASFLYRCDSRFYTEPLHEMLAEKDVYGLLLIDQGEAPIGLLEGKRISPLKNVQSLVPRKTRMGGQSARRVQRLHEQAAHESFPE